MPQPIRLTRHQEPAGTSHAQFADGTGYQPVGTISRRSGHCHVG